MEDASSSSSDDDKRRKKEKKKRKREKKARKKARKRAKKAAKRREASSDDDDDDEYEGWAAVDAAQRSRATDADAAWRDKLFGACAEDGDAEDPFGSGWGDAEDGWRRLVRARVAAKSESERPRGRRARARGASGRGRGAAPPAAAAAADAAPGGAAADSARGTTTRVESLRGARRRAGRHGPGPPDGVPAPRAGAPPGPGRRRGDDGAAEPRARRALRPGLAAES